MFLVRTYRVPTTMSNEVANGALYCKPRSGLRMDTVGNMQSSNDHEQRSCEWSVMIYSEKRVTNFCIEKFLKC